MANDHRFEAAGTPVETLHFDDDGRTPNNPYPVVIHRDAAAATDLASAFERLFATHGWPPQWRGGVFDFHHYHSVSHEALGITDGHARLMLGGEAGRTVELARGDVVILPAGTGHCRVSASADFALTAAYPPDQQDWDLCRPGETDPDAARERIARVSLPSADPVLGPQAGLTAHWR